MKCPACSIDLKMTERQSIEIDYCPQCRGVWLDRGELDKIIERASSELSSSRVDTPSAPSHQVPQQGYQRDQYYDDDDMKYGYKRRKRKGLLGEIFDF